MSWGHGAVQRALLAELQKHRRPISTMSLLRIICDGEPSRFDTMPSNPSLQACRRVRGRAWQARLDETVQAGTHTQRHLL